VAISVVNSSNAIEGLSSTTNTSSPTFTSTTGNLLVVAVSTGGAPGDASPAVTDTNSLNSFTTSESPSLSPGYTAGIAYSANITGQSGEAATYHVLTSGGGPNVALIEVAGCATTSPQDVAPAYQETNATVNSLNSSLITPPAGDHLLYVSAMFDQGTVGGPYNQSVTNNGTGAATWTTIKNDTVSGYAFLTAYAIVTANGTNTYGVTYAHGLSGINVWMVVGICAFKAAGGTTYNLSGSATQSQSLSVSQVVRRLYTSTVSAVQTQSLSLIAARVQTTLVALAQKILRGGL
jgi:hypothetical protein